jgi:hypothetical protein
MRLAVGFFKFWHDLLICDCWQIAAGIFLLMAIGIELLRLQLIPSGLFAILLGAGVMVLVSLIILVEARVKQRPE